MGTEVPHFGPPKSPTGVKCRPKWSLENQGPIIAPSATRGGRG